MYDDPSNDSHCKEGIHDDNLLTPFQCDICVFNNIFKGYPIRCSGDEQKLMTIRTINLDAM